MKSSRNNECNVHKKRNYFYPAWLKFPKLFNIFLAEMFARNKKGHIRHSTPSEMWTKSVVKI